MDKDPESISEIRRRNIKAWLAKQPPERIHTRIAHARSFIKPRRKRAIQASKPPASEGAAFRMLAPKQAGPKPTESPRAEPVNETQSPQPQPLPTTPPQPLDPANRPSFSNASANPNQQSPLGLRLSHRQPTKPPQQNQEELESAKAWASNFEVARLQCEQVAKSRPTPAAQLPSEYWELQRAKMTSRYWQPSR